MCSDGVRPEHGDLIRRAIASWRDGLVNLTGSNRLLKFRPRKTSAVTVTAPEPGELVGTLESGRTVEFETAPEEGEDADTRSGPGRGTVVTDATAADLSKALRNLLRRGTQEFMDRGLWVLYLAVGSLQWRDEAGTEYRSPLLLIPVELVDRGRDRLPSMRRAEEDALLNPALVLRLGQSGTDLPTLDDPDVLVVDDILRVMADAVRSRSGWEVRPDVVLSYFTFAKEAMYRDLLDNEERIAAHPGIGALSAGGRGDDVADFSFDEIPDAEIDERAPVTATPLVLDADSSQRACVAAAVDGRSFVMDGPPGTGKSQTIANVIGALLNVGKSVLFVSEKAAALDVVRNRLTDVGLGAYVLELHSHKATRKQVAAALGHALDHEPSAPPELGALDRDELEMYQRDLNAYAYAMNRPRAPLGLSLHEVLGLICEMDEVPSAPGTGVPSSDLTVRGLGEARQAARQIARAWRPATDGRSFVWRGVIERRSLEGSLVRADRALQRLYAVVTANEDTSAAFDLARPSQASLLQGLLAAASSRPAGVPDGWLTTELFDQVEMTVAELQRVLGALHDARAVAGSSAGVDWNAVPSSDELPAPDTTVPPGQSPAPIDPDELTAVECTRRAEELDADLSVLAEIRRAADDMSGLLGLAGACTIDDIGRLVGVARMAEDSDPPYGQWFVVGTTSARRAVSELSDIVEALSSAEATALDVFLPTALDHDPIGLEERFTTTHRGMFRTFSRAYRGDRDLVRSFARAESQKNAVGQIGLVADWARATRRLSAAENEMAAALGPYYGGRNTDLPRVVRALDNTDRVIRLIDGETGGRDSLRVSALTSLASLLGAETRTDAGLREAARYAGTELEAWADRARRRPDGRSTLPSGTLDAALHWLGSNRDRLRDVVGYVSAVDAAVGGPVSLRRARELVRLRDAADAGQRELVAGEDRYRRELDELYDGDRTDVGELDRAITWARSLRRVATGVDRRLVADQVSALHRAVPDPALNDAAREWSLARDAVLDAFDNDRRPELSEELDDYGDAEAVLSDLRQDRAGQEEWFTHHEARTQLARYHLEPTVLFCASERVPTADVPLVLEKALLTEWVDDLVLSDADLRPILSADRDHIVSEFQRLDERAVTSAVSTIIRSCAARRPRNMLGPVSTIRREADKKRKHMPVRELLARTGTVAQRITPCFMMSPLSVSQYLPPDLEFDVVVFDEASQVTPHDAINCIYRGRALITAGDQKQLPPTNFFGMAEDDSDEWDSDEDDSRDFDSILDLAKASGAYRSLTLRWHYRSRHESLIAFSNQSFYDGRLITFPGADHQGPDVGVEYFPVAGTYRRGSSRDNPVEAAMVAERVVHHCRTRPGRSVGVVTFSEAQATSIEAAVEAARAEHPYLDPCFDDDRLDGFFVKNLESVQGDERDVMIFSVGYGPDENGKTSMNFGPLNRAGGWRRLNVAVTRARFRNEIVASIRAADIMTAAGAEGRRHLRRYLDFAERGPSALALEVGDGGDAESPFEESVIQAIRSWGYDVTPQVGTASYRIDIGVRHPDLPGAFVLGVECDGAQYHSSRAARDRDRLREQVLTGLGWRLHRIWGTAWYRDRLGELARLQSAIEQACAEPVRGLLSAPSRTGSADRPAVGLQPARFEESVDWAVPYQRARVAPLPYWVELADPSSRAQIRSRIEEIVRVESPLHMTLLVERIRDAAGVARASQRARANIEAAVDTAAVTRRGDFVVRVDNSDVPVRKPADGYVRKVDHVPDDELTIALVRYVVTAGVVPEGDLTTAVARLFGWGRRGPDITSRLTHLIWDLCEMRVLMPTTSGLRAEVDETWRP